MQKTQISVASWPRRLAALAGLILVGNAAVAADLARTVAAVKPSVVGVGTFQKTRSPAIVFSGTGFVVGDGLSVITNAHVVPDLVDATAVEQLGIVTGQADQLAFRPALLAGIDREHDLAHLRLSGTPLPTLQLGDTSVPREGDEVAFTGFPLGMTLGLNAATHHGVLAAITPIVLPSLSARKLSASAIGQLNRSPFQIYQLDATAYPGNSGSPVYDPASGSVLGVINMVFVKGLKESAITNPSGITYAVPVRYVRDLLQKPLHQAK